MAATADYSGWVRELDSYEQQLSDADDPRLEPHRAPQALPATARGKSRAMSKPASQADELQQEMKLLNWHKLANEAALKAAIIKTNKIKKEDAHFASSLTLEEREERAMRIQQIVEEEQLRPLEVNSEFFRDFEAKGQRDESKLDDDVQRHIQHLRRLKDTMAQKEDAQRRRRRFREKMQELTPPAMASSRSVTKRAAGNQEEDAQQQRQQRTSAPNSVYQRIADTQQNRGRANAEVVGSLDKLMELEKRIRHLEDAGLGADVFEGDDGQMNGGDYDQNGVLASSNVRFEKRKTAGGPHEPSRTMYAVKPGPSKMRSRDTLAPGAGKKRSVQQPTAASSAKKRGLNGSNTRARKPETFLTSLPESKQKQLRRMTDRERRNFLKHEKATEEKERSQKQDVVIDGWLDKKKQAATQRKAGNTHVRNNPGGLGPGAAPTKRIGRQTLPPPPKVRAPALGAASGKRISATNPHMQRFEDIKKGFDKRKEMLQRAPPAVAATKAPGRGGLAATMPGQRAAGSVGATTRRSNGAQPNVSSRPAPGAAPSTQRQRQAGGSSSVAVGSSSRQTNPQVRLELPAVGNTRSSATVLPAIARADPVRATSNLGPTAGSRGLPGVSLPRIAAPSAARAAPPMPSPPPAKNPHGLQFSRLHKR